MTKDECIEMVTKIFTFGIHPVILEYVDTHESVTTYTVYKGDTLKGIIVKIPQKFKCQELDLMGKLS